jgi:hypothetical protein
MLNQENFDSVARHLRIGERPGVRSALLPPSKLNLTCIKFGPHPRPLSDAAKLLQQLWDQGVLVL